MTGLAGDVAVQAEALTFENDLPNPDKLFILILIEDRGRLESVRPNLALEDLAKRQLPGKGREGPQPADGDRQEQDASSEFHESQRNAVHPWPSPRSLQVPGLRGRPR